MTDRTKDDLINTLALDLDIIGLGVAVPDEDAEQLELRIDSQIDDLQARKKVYLPDHDTIPGDIFEALADCIAKRLAPKYGLPETDPVTMMAAEDRLKTVSRPTGSRRTMRIDPALAPGSPRFNFRNGT